MTCLGLSPLSRKRNCSVTFGARVKKEGEGEKYKNKKKQKYKHLDYRTVFFQVIPRPMPHVGMRKVGQKRSTMTTL